eukprot:1157866-Pelagomonas_calceolata.AAC.7
MANQSLLACTWLLAVYTRAASLHAIQPPPAVLTGQDNLVQLHACWSFYITCGSAPLHVKALHLVHQAGGCMQLQVIRALSVPSGAMDSCCYSFARFT